jgi:ribosomal protein S18 acetylase RimI-like enzyme
MSMNTLSPTIRRATAHDHATIVDFNCAMALETEGKALKHEVISRGVASLLGNEHRGMYFVAEQNEIIVGALMITYEWSDWRNGNFWWIQSVYVRPEVRGHGVYRAMYEHIRALATKDPGVCGFRLYVEQDNARAQRTYASLGMSETHYRMYEEMKPGIVFLKD